jgi:hypothetical protein
MERVMRVCSTTHVYHAMLNPEFGRLEAILRDGLRPLSDFPDSERWQLLEQQMPGFYRNLYSAIAEPVIQKPYGNTGIFVSPIDFQLLPGLFMKDRTRLKIPIARLDPAYCVLTYVLNDERIALLLTAENLETSAGIWDAAMVKSWFAKDQTKIFFYVPQIAVYQPGGIPIERGDIEEFAK